MKFFGEHHQPVQVHVGHLGLDHPELRQVPPRLRLLRPEGRPEAVHLAQRQRRGLDVELAALRQVRGIAKIVHREQSRCAFARRRRQNRRIGPDKSIRIKVFGRRPHDLRANAQDCRLPWATHPQVTPLLQKVDPMLFQRDGVRVRFGHALHHLHVLNVQLIPARRTLVRTHLPRDDHARFLRQPLQLLEDFRRHALHVRHSLDRPRPIAKNGKEQLPALARVVKPPLQGDRLPLVPPNFGNGRNGRSGLWSIGGGWSGFFGHLASFSGWGGRTLQNSAVPEQRHCTCPLARQFRATGNCFDWTTNAANMHPSLVRSGNDRSSRDK